MGQSQEVSATNSSEVGRLESMEMRGTVGGYRVGLNYTVRQDTELVAAHYFYVTHMKDIPLSGAVHGEWVDFSGADGANLHLHFVGNGSNGKEPLTFYNSVGLTGSWTLGSRSLPVNLRMTHSTQNPGHRLYGQVTDQSDSVFEAMVAGARAAILSGNAAEAARYINFPLRVNLAHNSITIQNEAKLKANWSRVFTPEFLTKLREDVAHEMFVHNGAVMLGDGELWFDDKGITVLNPVFNPKRN